MLFPAIVLAPQNPIAVQIEKRASARTDLITLKSVLDQFHLDVGRYPTTREGLNALVGKRSTIKDWRGPYIRKMPLDPWHHAYVYARKGWGFTLICYGLDGKPGGIGLAADLTEEG